MFVSDEIEKFKIGRRGGSPALRRAMNLPG